MKVKFSLGIGIHNATHKEEVELPDDYTEDQIEEVYLDWRSNYLDGGWTKLDEKGAPQ